MTARATISRWAMPPDSAATRASRPLGEAELLEQAVGLGLGGLGVHAEEAAVEVEVLPHVERAVEGVGLGHDADQPLGLGRVAHDVDAADEAPARGGDDPGGEHPGGGGLAGAVRSEQAEDLAPVDRRGRGRRRRGSRPGRPW